MLPFWVSVIIRHLLFRVYPKRDLNFDNYPFEGFRVLACGPTCGFRGALGYRVQACGGFGLGFRARLEIQGSRGSGLTAPACSVIQTLAFHRCICLRELRKRDWIWRPKFEVDRSAIVCNVVWVSCLGSGFKNMHCEHACREKYSHVR